MPVSAPELRDHPATHTRSGPVFVIGAARSGTSLLTWLIRRYLRVNFGCENPFIIRFYRRLLKYGDLHEDDNLKRLIADIAKERCFQRWTFRFGFVLYQQRVFDRVAGGPRGYPQVLDAIFGELALYQGLGRWGDMAPEYNLNLPILLNLFPDAQFVHIIRDGRDVALSGLKMHFGAGNVYRAAVEWRETMLRIGHFSSSLSSRQVFTIHYEALLTHPVETFGHLIDFLGIEPRNDLLSGIAADVPLLLRSGNSGKWETHLSKRQQQLFEQVAGDQLRRAGYRAVHEPSRIGYAQRLYWEADHRVRKAMRQKYWADNVHRTASLPIA